MRLQGYKCFKTKIESASKDAFEGIRTSFNTKIESASRDVFAGTQVSK